MEYPNNLPNLCNYIHFLKLITNCMSFKISTQSLKINIMKHEVDRVPSFL